jgi:hypothetical protein
MEPHDVEEHDLPGIGRRFDLRDAEGRMATAGGLPQTSARSAIVARVLPRRLLRV